MANLIVVAILVINHWYKVKVGEFSLRDYQTYIEQFPSDIIVGAVETENEAITIAEDIWTDVYGKNVQFKKPYKVFYDADSEVWLVQGSLPFYQNGGVPYILIEKESGRVLAVWHDK